MTSYKYTFHGDIALDYNDAYFWYESQKEGLGERFLTAVRRKIEEIAEAPEFYSVKTKKGYREAKVDIFPYVIVYKIYKRQKLIFFNSIHHERKHPGKKYRK